MTHVVASIDLAYWQSTLIKLIVVALLVPTTALILGIVFLFKVMSWMQSRKGPQEAGPRGLLQLLAAGAKSGQKEDLIPTRADRFVFKAPPPAGWRSPRLSSPTLPAAHPLVIPDRADRFVFKAAPLVVLMSTLLLYAILPASQHLVIADLDVGIFFALAVSSLSVIGVLMAGWGSANKYSLMGGLRAGGQLIAYEL